MARARIVPVFYADGVVHEVHAAFVLEISFIRQPHRDRIGRVA
jgi:hypothetical protein